MNRKTITGLIWAASAAVLAAGIWFLYRNLHYFGYGPGAGPWHHPGHMMMGFGGMGIFMIIFWIIVIVALTAWILNLLSARNPAGRLPVDGLEAREILKQRYALGEIDRAQFEIMYRDLDR